MSNNTAELMAKTPLSQQETWIWERRQKAETSAGSHNPLAATGENVSGNLNTTAIEMMEVSNGFAVFMDKPKMLAIFQQELPDCVSGKWSLVDCKIQHPRYKTYLNPKSWDKSFLALAYHLIGINEHTHEVDDRILYVKAYLGSRSQAEYLKACSKVGLAEKNAVFHIEKYGMVAWFFPCDPALPWLPKVLDSNEIKAYFADFLLLQKNSPSCVIKAMYLTIVNYRPEIRCTFRYELKRLSGTRQTLYGKTFADDKGVEIHSRIAHLYQRAEKKPESFVMPRLLGYDYTLHTLWMEGLEGKPIVDLIDEHNADHLMAQIAKHLVDFHSASIDGLVLIRETEQLAEIHKKSAKLQTAYPDYSSRIENLIGKLNAQKPDLPLDAMRLVHGDFHIQQLLLLDDNRIALFDFDELAMANPLLDVANFCADLYTLNLGNQFTDYVINRLFTAYKALSEDDINAAQFDWYLRLQLLTRAYRAYIQRKPDLDSLINQFLTAAEIGYVGGYADKRGLM
jgi:aminoglycoside phosphotransferase